MVKKDSRRWSFSRIGAIHWHVHATARPVQDALLPRPLGEHPALAVTIRSPSPAGGPDSFHAFSDFWSLSYGPSPSRCYAQAWPQS